MTDLLILGGTGKVGRRVADLVESRGHAARRASRHGPVRFDWRDEGGWAEALNGANAVFITGPGSAADWSPLLTRFLDQANDFGVQRAVLLSARGVEFLPGGAVDLAERALAAGPVPWTILRPTHFVQNFTEAMFVPVAGTITAPVGDGAEPFIDVQDLAEVAAETLTMTDRRFVYQVLDLSGPEAIDFATAAQILGDVAGSPITFVRQSADEHADELRGAGTPEGYVQWRLAMLGGIERGDDAYLSDGIPRVLGRPARSFRSWALREVPTAPWRQALPGQR